MYIPEFWCGVAATLAVEFVIIIVAAVVSERKGEEKQWRI